jgi:hypothetical protein
MIRVHSDRAPAGALSPFAPLLGEQPSGKRLFCYFPIGHEYKLPDILALVVRRVTVRLILV